MKSLIVLILVGLPLSLSAHKYYMDGDFPGIKEDDSEIKKIIVVHGTGVKHPLYSISLIKNMASFMGFEPDSGKKARYYLNYNIIHNAHTIITDIHEYKSPEQTVHFYSVTWSELTKPFKERLLAEDDLYNDHRAMRRGAPAKLIKEEVFISQLSDFMLYNNEEIRNELYSALDRLLMTVVPDDDPIEHKGKYDYYLRLGPNEGNLKEYPQLNDELFSKTKRIHAITGSLASNIMYDFGKGLKPGGTKRTKAEIESRKKVRNFYKSISGNLYMLTNQLNLLRLQYQEIGKYDKNPLDTVDSDALFLKNLNIVAFRDPADPLCYHVPQKYFSKSEIGINITNVIIKSKSFYEIFIKAHTKPFRNKKLHQLIFEGSKGHKQEWHKKFDYSRHIPYGV